MPFSDQCGVWEAGRIPAQNVTKTIKLWPEAGRSPGLGRNATYDAAERGQIPGAVKIGGRWIVLAAVFDRFVNEGVIA
jgi:hypothetical protein